MESFELEKYVWSKEDFAFLGWHDSKIWGFMADTEKFEFMVDLDYIFKWVKPEQGEAYFKFWVAPVTMVFENAHEIVLDIDSGQGEIEVVDLHMENERKTLNGLLSEHDFRFECQEGDFKITATGFKMYIRKAPVLLSVQALRYETRGGIGFGRGFIHL